MIDFDKPIKDKDDGKLEETPDDFVLDLVEKYGGKKISISPNYRSLLVIDLGINDDAMEEFNRIYFWIKQSKINDIRLRRTQAGEGKLKGISTDKRWFCGCGWDVEVSTNSVELVILVDGWGWRFRFKNKVRDEIGVSGTDAFRLFKAKCKKYGIDLDSYKIENGLEVKKTIPKPPICWGEMGDLTGQILKGVHHLDFHNSYPAGLCESFPEFTPVVEEFYQGRAQHEEYKAVLNLTVGYLQSKWNGAKWAHMSKCAIENNNSRITRLALQLWENDRVPLAYNTDGIWYAGEVYHGKGEGKNLGEWENDYVDCMIRFKSIGSYEFEGTKVKTGEFLYKPVVRGMTRYDKVLPRDKWVWGDIFRDDVEPLAYEFSDEYGIQLIEKEIDLWMI